MTDIKYQVATAICTVLMAAACFPEEQAKVQAELDTVIGRHRGSSISIAVPPIQWFPYHSTDLCRPTISSLSGSLHLGSLEVETDGC
jgi:hypothetical protein